MFLTQVWTPPPFLAYQNRCPKRYGIYFGDKFIQIYKWRIADHDGKFLSISYANKRVTQFIHENGRVKNKRGGSRYHAWNRKWKAGQAKGVFFGHDFIQVGSFRLGTLDRTTHFSISHEKTGQTPVIYRSDGRHFYGPRTSWGLQGRPACIGPKPSAWEAKIIDPIAGFSTPRSMRPRLGRSHFGVQKKVPRCHMLCFGFIPQLGCLFLSVFFLFNFVRLLIHGDGAHLHNVSYFHPFPSFKIFQARDLRRTPGN